MSVISHLAQKLNQPANRSLTLLSVMLGATLTLTACGGDDHHEVSAIDRVDEAAELARKNAPKAEILEEIATVEATNQSTTETAATTTEEMGEDSTAQEANKAQPAAADETQSESEPEVVAVASQDSGLAADAGKKLYESNCKACHATGLLNSPKFGDKAAWKERIPKGREVLATHSAEGFNQMPAQAVNGVTFEQVQAAVDYMIEAAS